MKKTIKKLKKKIYFDGKIDLGIILTLITILIAWFSLRVSEKELETKVTEIQNLVEKLDEAELERLNLKIDDINNSTENINKRTDLWEYVTDNNKNISSIIEQRHFESSIIIKEIIRILNTHKVTNKEDKILLGLLNQMNDLTLEFNAIAENSSNLRLNYVKENEPNKEKLSNKDYLELMPGYIKNLQSFNDSVNSILEIKSDSISELRSLIWDEYINKKAANKTYKQ